MTARLIQVLLVLALVGCGGSSPEEAYRAGLEHAEQGSFDDAVAAFSEALEARPDWTAALVDRGVARAALGDIEGALRDYDEALRLDPENTAALVSRGVARHEQGRYGDALEDYSRALAHNETDVVAYRNRALTFVAAEEFVAAVEDYDAAVRLEPDDVGLYGERAEVRRLMGDENGVAVDLALAEVTAAIAAAPDDPATWHRRGLAFFEVGEYVLAVADQDEAIRLAPDDPDTFLARAQASYVLGQGDRAIKDYTGALDLDVAAAAEAHAGRGLAYLGIGNVAKAVADYEEAIRLDPDDEDTAIELAWIYATHPGAQYRNGERAVVLAGREEARSDGRWWRALDVLAAARAELGQFNEARDLAERALDFVPDEERDAVLKRLALYRAAKPCRER